MRIFLVPPTNDHRSIDCPPYHSPLLISAQKQLIKQLKVLFSHQFKWRLRAVAKTKWRGKFGNTTVIDITFVMTQFQEKILIERITSKVPLFDSTSLSTWPQYPAPAAPFFNTLETTPTGGGYNQSAIFGSPFCVYGILAEKLLLLSINGCWQI